MKNIRQLSLDVCVQTLLLLGLQLSRSTRTNDDQHFQNAELIHQVRMCSSRCHQQRIVLSHDKLTLRDPTIHWSIGLYCVLGKYYVRIEIIDSDKWLRMCEEK